MLLTANRLFGIDVCLVNDSDCVIFVSVVAGSGRFEKSLEPKSHAFVTLEDTNDDRVVIAQKVGEPRAAHAASPIKVVSTKVLTEHQMNRRFFCYVHQTTRDIQMDILAYDCLDIVPYRWGKDPSGDEPSRENYLRIRSQLIRSLKSTSEIDPETSSGLKKSLREFPLGDAEQ